MHPGQDRRIELLVFALVAAALTTLYITQPVLVAALLGLSLLWGSRWRDPGR